MIGLIVTPSISVVDIKFIFRTQQIEKVKNCNAIFDNSYNKYYLMYAL